MHYHDAKVHVTRPFAMGHHNFVVEVFLRYRYVILTTNLSLIIVSSVFYLICFRHFVFQPDLECSILRGLRNRILKLNQSIILHLIGEFTGVKRGPF